MDNKHVKIYGKVTDFNNTPLSGAIVRLINNKFEDLYITSTDDDGKYELEIEQGLYYTFYACKDYKINYLEYWAWNVPIFNDMKLDARIDGLELYGLNAFRVQGAYPSISLYFRPMSLKKGKELEELAYWNSKTKTDKKFIEILDICPELSKKDIEVQIDGEKVEVFEANKILEYCGKADCDKNQYIYSYLIQIALPASYRNRKYEYKKIHITLTDRKTGEKGEGSVFWKEEKSM